MYMISPVQSSPAGPRPQGLFQIGGGHPGFGGLPGMRPGRAKSSALPANPRGSVPPVNPPQSTGGGKLRVVKPSRITSGANPQQAAAIEKRKRLAERQAFMSKKAARRKDYLRPGGGYDQDAYREQLTKRGLLSPLPGSYGTNQLTKNTLPPFLERPAGDDPMRFLRP